MRRRRKEEIAAKRKQEEEEKAEFVHLKSIRDTVEQKRYKLDAVPQILDQNEQLISYLKNKGVMNEKGDVSI
jgi:hypothetical protein